MRAVTSIAIVDEHPLFAEGVHQTLRASGAFSVVGVGLTREEAVAIAKEKRPDILILNVTIVGGGLEAARLVQQSAPDTKIVFLTDTERDEDVSTALGDGARGYLLKRIEKAQLISVLKEIARGQVYVDPQLAARMLARARQAAALQACQPDLTPRENEILALVAQGMTNKEVAKSLRLGDKTVKHHMTSIMQKLQVRNRVEAVLYFKTIASPRPNAMGVQSPTATWSTPVGSKPAPEDGRRYVSSQRPR
jgi:two-component system nitrate/nitrite response regulator NarL